MIKSWRLLSIILEKLFLLTKSFIIFIGDIIYVLNI